MYKGNYERQKVLFVLGFLTTVLILRTKIINLKTFPFPVTWASILICIPAAMLFARRKLPALLMLHILVSACLFSGDYFHTPYKIQQEVSEKELISLSEILIEKISACHIREADVEKTLEAAAAIMNDTPPRYANLYSIGSLPPPDGIFIPATGYTYVSKKAPEFLLPFVAVHELTHRAGFADEGQTNLHAFLKCIRSGRDEFIYSACIYALSHIEACLSPKEIIARGRLPERAIRDLERMNVKSNFSKFPWKNYGDIVQGLAFLMNAGALL